MAIRCCGCMQMKENSPICEHCGHDEQTQSQSHQLPAGTVVGGQYTLGKVLGQGGFGITYIGWDNILNQRVAVKEFFPSGYAGRDIRTTLDVTSYDGVDVHAFEASKRRFLREAESLAKLWSVPQIIRVLRYFEENGTAYIAMEYAEGEDLRNYMKRLGRPLTMEEVRTILGPIMIALEQVHKAELVHRDISPDNIMVLPDGSSKLLDFGAARYVENADAEKDRNTSTQAILKHGFAPPEQYRSHGALGPWTDIYAMCATVYYCLAGRIPPESMSRMMGEEQLKLDAFSGLTSQQKYALEKGMALVPKERISTIEQLYRLLFSDLTPSQKAELAEDQARRQREEEEKRRQEKARIKEEERKAEAAQKEKQRKQAQQRKQETREKKRKRPVALIAAAVAVLAAAAGMFLMKPNSRQEKPVLQVQTTAATTAVTEQATVAVIAETEAMPTTAATEPEPEWQRNVLCKTIPGSENDGLEQWWENNKNRYGGTYNGTFTITSGGVTISMPTEAHEDYLQSLPVFGSDIPRNKVAEVHFLDTLADMPENAWDVSYYKNGTVWAWSVPAGSGLHKLYIAAEGGVNGQMACRQMFQWFTNLRVVRCNGNFHLDYAQDAYAMFEYCGKLTEVDAGDWNTSNIQGMVFMFKDCVSLVNLDVSNWDTSSVTDMSFLFFGCTALKALDVSRWNTSCVTDMGYLFHSCSSLKALDVSNWDTSSATDFGGMFGWCTGLTALDVSRWNTSKVIKVSGMFYGCTNLSNLNASGWDTSRISDLDEMF